MELSEKPRAKAANAAAARFVIRWAGYQIGTKPQYLTLRRGQLDSTADMALAKRFVTHAEAAQFCKENVRNRIFGGDWQRVTRIEKMP